MDGGKNTTIKPVARVHVHDETIYPRDASDARNKLWFTPVSPKRAIVSPLWPTYVLPALESQGARETIGKLATHVIYISGGQ